MKDIYIIGKEPCVSAIASSLCNYSDIYAILWDESVRNKVIHFRTDVVVCLAFNNNLLSISVKEWLMVEYGINDNNIIDYKLINRYLFPKMKVDRLYYSKENYQGLIMGLSHANVGILPEMLPVSFANIAVSAQDIFSNYKSLEYLVEKYPERIIDLKYVIYDVFDYTYFNYDCSMSNNALQYYFEWGGFLDSHNFDKNKNYSNNFKYYLNQHESSFSEMINNGVIEFVNSYVLKNEYMDRVGLIEEGFVGNRWRVVSDVEIDEYDGDNSLVNNCFIDTINENDSYFEKTLDLLLKINPDMKICLMILPHLPIACYKIEGKYKTWKELFYDRIETLEKKYRFRFYDYKNCSKISNRVYFYDCEHLNYFGARRFTGLINNEIGW